MFTGVIARRVNLVIKQRIKDAQEKYDSGVVGIKEKEDVALNEIRVKSETERYELQDSLVDTIIGTGN